MESGLQALKVEGMKQHLDLKPKYFNWIPIKIFLNCGIITGNLSTPLRLSLHISTLKGMGPSDLSHQHKHGKGAMYVFVAINGNIISRRLQS